jgi:hypothetical protein
LEPYILQFALKISIASHEIPWHPFSYGDEAGHKKQGRLKTPNKAIKDRLIQAPRLITKPEIRRASEQTSPPGGMRSRTPSDGTDGGSSSGSSLIRLFYFTGSKVPKRSRKANGE